MSHVFYSNVCKVNLWSKFLQSVLVVTDSSSAMECIATRMQEETSATLVAEYLARQFSATACMSLL